MHKTSLKLIAVDLDGTLLRHDSTMAPEGGRALAAADALGVHVILATTRNLDSVLRFAREIGLDRPLICTNGAQILASPTGPVWRYLPLAPELAQALVDQADARAWSLMTTVGEVTYYRQRAGQTLGPMDAHRVVVARNAEALAQPADPSAGPIRVLNYEADAIPELRRFCAAHFPGQYHLETYYYPDGTVKSIGIYAPGADKGTALNYVLQRLQIRPAQVMAIGDNPNDLPLFELARVRVAMGNATPEVKEVATAIAPNHDEEGVAWAVRRFILKGETHAS